MTAKHKRSWVCSEYEWLSKKVHSFRPALPELVPGDAVRVLPSCREHFNKRSSGNTMPKQMQACKCHASPLLWSVGSRVVAVVISETHCRVCCLAFSITGKILLVCTWTSFKYVRIYSWLYCLLQFQPSCAAQTLQCLTRRCREFVN